jgi:hypothetical protein
MGHRWHVPKIKNRMESIKNPMSWRGLRPQESITRNEAR